MPWNQKETDTGFLLFAGMARLCPRVLLQSYNYSNSIQVVFSSV